MHGFQIKRIKEQKYWIKIIQGLGGLVNVFSILVSTESLVLTHLIVFNRSWCFNDL